MSQLADVAACRHRGKVALAGMLYAVNCEPDHSKSAPDGLPKLPVLPGRFRGVCGRADEREAQFGAVGCDGVRRSPSGAMQALNRSYV
jgi:hypothetical protein